MATRKSARKGLKPRKSPVQKRSTETVAVILEAAARILELRGFEGFNTNAIAGKAGVSIGSLYQYFPNKDALLSGLIARECAPLLEIGDELAQSKHCSVAMRAYIRASIRHQMRRPRLAQLIDVAEKREAFQHQVLGTQLRLRGVMERILDLEDAPRVIDKSLASDDLLALIRGLVDAAGERREAESPELLQRVEGAVWGYLQSSVVAKLSPQ
jgi:AcrR family transcriptional regulator